MLKTNINNIFLCQAGSGAGPASFKSQIRIRTRKDPIHRFRKITDDAKLATIKKTTHLGVELRIPAAVNVIKHLQRYLNIRHTRPGETAAKF